MDESGVRLPVGPPREIFKNYFGLLVQSAEHPIRIGEVTGAIPVQSTVFLRLLPADFFEKAA